MFEIFLAECLLRTADQGSHGSIGRVVGDHARAEELAVEAFWKLWRSPRAQGDKAGGWVYRTAVRLALNELRRQHRATRYELLSGLLSGQGRQSPTPEEAHAAAEERARDAIVMGVKEHFKVERAFAILHLFQRRAVCVHSTSTPATQDL